MTMCYILTVHFCLFVQSSSKKLTHYAPFSGLIFMSMRVLLYVHAKSCIKSMYVIVLSESFIVCWMSFLHRCWTSHVVRCWMLLFVSFCFSFKVANTLLSTNLWYLASSELCYCQSQSWSVIHISYLLLVWLHKGKHATCKEHAPALSNLTINSASE